MFDRVEITVRAGDGGNGVVSFRREKFVPFGGPDGGDGGDGGDVIIITKPNVTDLKRLHYRKFYRAGNGQHGASKKKHGKKGKNLLLAVPAGTLVINQVAIDNDALIADLAALGQEVVAARGGKGGWGNTHYASSTNQMPQIAQRGEVGAEVGLILELRLIADIGIIGYPNAGKSTLLAAVSAAKPKIASYPFTTLEPVLGVVEINQQAVVLAEIPGLIEGAHIGHGLGHDFLRHVGRTKMLLHLVDGSSPSPVDDMIRVNNEIGLFDSALAQKPQLVAVNKIDLPQVEERRGTIKDAFTATGIPVHFISALTGQGIDQLLAAIVSQLEEIAAQTQVSPRVPPKVFRPQPRPHAFSVYQVGDTFVVVAPELSRLVASKDATQHQVRGQIKQRLSKLGVNRVLEKAGIKPGDRVRCGQIEWEWD